MNRFIIFTSVALLLIMAAGALAAIPQQINYQGLLTTSGGTPVPDGSYSVVFTIYTAPTGGIALWTETKSVTTSSGLFSTLLGSVTPIPDSAFATASSYLGIKVGADPEITPRQQLASVPYAYRVASFPSSGDSVDCDSTGDCIPQSEATSLTPVDKTLVGTQTIINPMPGQFVATDGLYKTIVLDGLSGNVRACGKATFGELSTNHGKFAFVAGCNNNIPISGDFASISGGSGNLASNAHTTVGGGINNTARGVGATVPGGSENTASGDYSFAAGRQAVANDPGAFVWADNIGSPFASTANNQFWVRANGGARIVGHPTTTEVPQLRVDGSISIWKLDENTSLFFGQEHVPSLPGNAGEWGIQYWRDAPNAINGLNFWKPSGSTGSGFANNVLFLDDNHNVGIGTAKPGTKLAVVDPVIPSIGINDGPGPGNKGGLDLAVATGFSFWSNIATPGDAVIRVPAQVLSGPVDLILANRGNGAIRFTTGTTALETEKMTILNTGYVGIGTTTPAEKLSVVGNICATGTIDAVGAITQFSSCPSDSRFKTNVTTVDNGLGLIMRLRGVRYDWDREHFPERHFSDAHQIGFIAQEMKEVVPELVTKMSDGYYAVDYSRLAPVLVEAIKELKVKTDRIEELEQKVSEIDQLKSQLAVMSDQLTKLLAAQSKNAVDTKLAVNDKSNQTAGK